MSLHSSEIIGPQQAARTPANATGRLRGATGSGELVPIEDRQTTSPAPYRLPNAALQRHRQLVSICSMTSGENALEGALSMSRDDLARAVDDSREAADPLPPEVILAAMHLFWEMKPPVAAVSKTAQAKWVRELSTRAGGAVLEALDVLAKRPGFPADLADVLAEVGKQQARLEHAAECYAAAHAVPSYPIGAQADWLAAVRSIARYLRASELRRLASVTVSSRDEDGPVPLCVFDVRCHCRASALAVDDHADRMRMALAGSVHPRRVVLRRLAMVT